MEAKAHTPQDKSGTPSQKLVRSSLILSWEGAEHNKKDSDSTTAPHLPGVQTLYPILPTFIPYMILKFQFNTNHIFMLFLMKYFFEFVDGTKYPL